MLNQMRWQDNRHNAWLSQENRISGLIIHSPEEFLITKELMFYEFYAKFKWGDLESVQNSSGPHLGTQEIVISYSSLTH